ncbi:uncharacterized protein B0H18DRAFT_983709 [Fomitopsis serialis]|uniref:uncharacterized protein n=1 Tax=Fomitopsis serialis TaxID=139415 RepID=UPI0020081AC4|nr:uncharacterized protein B0H18DRAFT_983709 [Neoantrodia serialis]KAH9933442.1 hypothetical protein B0H18DRAFT_983709 [Neoantrodia serialis]
MSSKRDSLFLTGSIGRNPSISRTASHESLSTHPLLSPAAPGSPTTTTTTTSAESVSGAPRYVPYTPRHRVTPTSATSGTTMQPSISTSGQQSASHSDATSKLQIMSLKAATQRMGLDTTTTGWAILERLSTETDHGPEWNDIWNALSFSKATLLLPLDHHRSNDLITPEFIKDHIALCDGTGRNNAPVVTSLLNPAARSSALSALPPLPNSLLASATLVPPSPSSSTSSIQSSLQYPTFKTHSYSPAFPSHRARPCTRSQRSGESRIAPFEPICFFVRSRHATGQPVNRPDTSPLRTQPSLINDARVHPTGSLSSQVTPSPDRTSPAEHSLDVPAFTISTRVDRATLGRSLTDVIRGEMRAVLGDAGVPSWAIERVKQFAEPCFPSPNGDPGAVARAVSGGGRGRGRGSGEWVIATNPSQGAEDVSNKFQEFYNDLEDMLWARLPKSGHKLRKGHGKATQHAKEDGGDVGPPSTDDVTEEKAADETEMGEEEKRTTQIRVTMDAIERVLCCLLYDRLFLPESADDAEHDEALSSRIAAVNLLDLGLGHLGVDVGNSSKEVEAVVGRCGKALVQLDTVARSPAEKAAVLVSVHKIIVDGLAKLPPIGLKPEDEILDDAKTPRAKTTFGRHSAEDDNDVDEQEPTTTTEPVPGLRNVDSEPDQPVVSPTIVLSPVDISSASEGMHLPTPATQDASSVSSDLIPPRSASLRSQSPIRTASSRTSSPTPVSGDVILPLMIFAVVKANPPRLVSNLLYIQRFRRESTAGGEEGYCLVNLMAVAEFLENVDLAALGLGDSENTVLSPAQLSPMPLARSVRGAQPPSPQAISASLRGRVEQQVDAITGSANKVLSGVVDSSFGVLRSLLPGQSQSPIAATTPAAETTEESSRPPGSSRSVRAPEDDTTTSEEGTTGDEGDERRRGRRRPGHDARSIRSFESMMSERNKRRKGKRKFVGGGRMSLTDRLASMPGLSRLSHAAQSEAAKYASIQASSPPGSRRSSLLIPATTATNRFDTPASSRAASPIAIRVSPPNPRFLACTEDDIKVSEVGELLREYKRLAEAIRAMGGFNDEV